MADLEKVLKGWERCDKCNFPTLLGDQKPYLECEYTVGLYCGQDKLIRQTRELVREQEEIINSQSKCISALMKKIDDLKEFVESRPQIVLCKDCKHWSAERINDFNKCKRWINVGVKNFATTGDWFCADGEKKDG